MKLSDLRDAGNVANKLKMDAMRDVFQPRGVTFSFKVRRKLPGSEGGSGQPWFLEQVSKAP